MPYQYMPGYQPMYYQPPMPDQLAQTAELIRRINPMPVPAYQVPNPYAGCGCNPCGCGC